jgi:hypothetical protein
MQALLTFLLAALLAAPAAAGTTTIDISQRARVAEGVLVVELRVGNSGDEAALSVTPILRFGDRGTRQGISLDQARLRETRRSRSGRWARAAGRIIWRGPQDLNQYPFQALQVQALVVGSPPPAKVVVPAIQGGDISGTGTLAITVKNLTPESRTARIHVLVPAGIVATRAARELSLDAWQGETLEVSLTNRTALVGSRLPAFVSVEYDDGPMHQAVVARGSLAVLGEGSFIERWGRWLSSASIALVLAWLA